MRSLNARLLMAATLTLAAFLGLTGFALDQAFQKSALTAVQDRLQGQVYTLLSAAKFEASDQRTMPTTLPDPRLSTPGSGLYAQLVREDGTLLWRSLSMLGLSMPVSRPGRMGVPSFGTATASDGTPLFTLAFSVAWEDRRGDEQAYIVQVAESKQGYLQQVSSFRRSLWGWFAAAGIVLLAVQALILRWGLRPLRMVAEEVKEVESGRKGALVGGYPAELQRLVTNLNALIRNSEAHLERYRRALGDLAHSFKTPLAVMRGAAESGAKLEELRETVREQVNRLDHTVAYQLQRAAASGRSALATPIAVEPIVAKVLQSLTKVYADRKLTLDRNVSKGLDFYGDEGDLMEILGNLADNACKWANRRVRVRAKKVDGAKPSRGGIELAVDDDGPGIPAEQWDAIFRRGFRGDAAVEGHGIGLAIVKELVEEVYRGDLTVARSDLGGASVRARVSF
ncbi:MAG: ATP-binding protein [Chromatiales bacterium]